MYKTNTNPMDYQPYDDNITTGKDSVSATEVFSGEPVMLSPTLYGGARLMFAKKVYTILSIQLLVTVAVTVASMYSPAFQDFQVNTMWVLWVCLGFIIVSEIVVLCLPVGRKPPLNMICLGFFTLGESYLVSLVCSLTAESDGKFVVLMAALMTLAITISVTVYAMVTKTDFTARWGITWVLLCGLLFMGILSIFFYSQFMYVLFCTLGVVLFGIYLIIDTQLIMGGKRLALSIDDYAAAAMLLYVDIIQMFLYLLSSMRN